MNLADSAGSVDQAVQAGSVSTWRADVQAGGTLRLLVLRGNDPDDNKVLDIVASSPVHTVQAGEVVIHEDTPIPIAAGDWIAVEVGGAPRSSRAPTTRASRLVRTRRSADRR
jgi:hypothetical protein